MMEFETLMTIYWLFLFIAFMVYLSAVTIMVFRNKKTSKQSPLSRAQEKQKEKSREEVLGPHV